MALQLSPGVVTTEFDASTVVPGTAATGGAIAGPFLWGPANVATQVTSEINLVSQFGEPDTQAPNTFFTATSFLSYANNLTVVRTLSAAAQNAAVLGTSISELIILNGGLGYASVPTIVFTGGGGTGAAATAVLTNGVITSVTLTNQGVGYTSAPTISLTGGTPIINAVLTAVVGVVIPNVNVYNAAYAAGQGTVGQWAAKYAGAYGNNIAVSIADAGNFANWQYAYAFNGAPGTSDSVALLGGSNDELHIAVIDKTGAISGIANEVIESFAFVSKAKDAQTDTGQNNYYPNVLNTGSQYIYWMDHPVTTPLANWGSNSANTVFDTLATTIVLNSTTESGTFVAGETVNVFSGSVTSIAATKPGAGFTAPIVVTLSGGGGVGAAATATLNTAIGGITAITPGSTGASYVTPVVTITGGGGTGATATATLGTGGNAGKVVAYVITNTGTGYTSVPTVSVTDTGGGSGATGTAVLSLGQITGYTVTNVGSGYTSAPTVSVTGATGSGAVGTAAVTFTSSSLRSAKVVSWNAGSFTLTVNDVSGEFLTTDQLKGQTSSAVGVPTSVTEYASYYTLVGGVTGNNTITDANLINGLDLLMDDSLAFTYLMMADADSNVTNYAITSLAEVNTYFVVCLSPPQSAVVNNTNNEAAACVAYRNLLPSSSYAFMDSMWVSKYDAYNDVYRWIPANGDTAGLMALTASARAPWFSPAGLNRGQLKNVNALAWNPSLPYRNTLYQNGINPIVIFAGQGPVLWGDKTMQTKPSAFDRINVRLLFIVVRESIANAAQYSLFEFNDDTTRGQFRALVDPYLRNIQGQRGIYAYQIVCDTTNNTSEVIDSNTMQGDIYISPAKSINFINLNFIATRTNVDFSEIVGQF